MTGNIDIPSKTYEDILAVALINLILSKYNEYFRDEDYQHFGSLHLQANQQRTAFSQTGNSAKHLTTRAVHRPLTTTVRTKTSNLPLGKNAQQMNDEEGSELSSLSSTTTSSSSSSSTSSFSSSSTADSISSSSSDSSCELSGQCLKPVFNTVYDGSLGLYLSEKSESVGDNWTLKPEQKLYLFNSIFGLQRLNVRQSLNSFLTNLTDDLKEELQPEMQYFNEETDCEYTEKHFESVLHYRSPPPNVVYEKQRLYLQLGEEIGESSTDDFEDKLLPVLESVQLFESLSIGRNTEFSKVQQCSKLI